MNLLKSRQDVINEVYKQTSDLGILFPEKETNTREEVVYRRNGRTVDKILEFDIKTGSKIRTTHYDYFDDKKIRSIDEYDIETGKKLRTINYILYKSIDEYDIETGKKLRTINYNVKDDTKISSIQDYDLESGKITTISIFKRDGKTVSITKKLDPQNNNIVNYVHKNTDNVMLEQKSFSTRSYDNIETQNKENDENVARLIDDLYSNNMQFGNVN